MRSILFEPVNIKNIQLKNRFVRSAEAEGLATFDGRPTQKLRELYFKLAEGEIGLIITSGKINIEKDTYASKIAAYSHFRL